ncbi:winged helix-turn-helix domain-containing protein [Porphyrobacter sp. HT-58-2]|uniref:winged helix-turn-helix domain-containing protein n=1 Tax=Porphyrobacter sp. HT-58-2 TaxID=2023229 RepID=UPI001F226BA9|nr:winged helix-turn-helix domain-containing protein [Porphyrobacter sp. HT-58-2]
MNAISRADQFPANDTLIPRFREAGDITLDLFHRDGRVDDCWLGLHPREFALMWRLAEQPGERMTRRELLAEVWRIHFEPETNSVAVHVARVRAKLEPFGLSRLIATHPDGGYFLDLPTPSGMAVLAVPRPA